MVFGKWVHIIASWISFILQIWEQLSVVSYQASHFFIYHSRKQEEGRG